VWFRNNVSRGDGDFGVVGGGVGGSVGGGGSGGCINYR
jgi:hypothetical protein